MLGHNIWCIIRSRPQMLKAKVANWGARNRRAAAPTHRESVGKDLGLMPGVGLAAVILAR